MFLYVLVFLGKMEAIDNNVRYEFVTSSNVVPVTLREFMPCQCLVVLMASLIEKEHEFLLGFM